MFNQAQSNAFYLTMTLQAARNIALAAAIFDDAMKFAKKRLRHELARKCPENQVLKSLSVTASSNVDAI
jgi:hypothetical protein